MYLDGVTLSEASAWIRQSNSRGPKYYIHQMPIREKISPLLNDLPAGQFSPKSVINFWFGSAGNQTPLHYDFVENVFVQIYGRKTFTFYSPDQTDHLYRNPPGTTNFHMSQIDLSCPDYEKFPLFRKAKAIKIGVSPGDMLIIPAGWWHHVVSDSCSISLNFWTPYDNKPTPSAN